MPAKSHNLMNKDGFLNFSDVNLVHVVRQYLPQIGGLEDVVRNLTAHQRDRFSSLKIITLDHIFTKPTERLPAHEVIDGIEVIRIPFHGSPRYPIAPRVFKLVKNADLVHVHAVDFFFDAFAFSNLWHRKKLLCTTHGGFFHTQNYGQLKRVWFNTMTRFSAMQYSKLACCGVNDFEMFRKIAPNKVELIENGVNIKKFQNASSEFPTKRLLTIGRFSKNKRIDRLLDMLKVLSNEDSEWHLSIAGMASDITENALIDEINHRGLQHNVSVHIGLSEAELRNLIKTCSLFVSASEYEGFGLVLIEALSAGLIPVVQNNTAFASLAKKHPSVVPIDFSDVPSAANSVKGTLQFLKRNPDLREQSASSTNIYSWENTVKKYDEIYHKILNS